MSTLEHIHGLPREEVDHLLYTALLRLSFVRHTDPAYELRRLRRDFGFDEYQRSETPQPQDHEVPA